MYSASYVWAKVLHHMEQQLSEVAVSAWFDDAEVIDLTENEFVLYSPSEFRQERIRVNCAPYVEDALKQLFQSDAKLVVWGETEMKTNRDRQKQKSESFFNPMYAFENFIVRPGSDNEMPLRIASAVAAAPGVANYNPLFFYGPPGVGKTHLLYSIANSVSTQYPHMNIVCIKGEQFTNDLVKAIQGGSTALFREKYREADLLLVDDVQFIAGKESTQEEFFHTFNALYESGKQIVLTADRKPADMATLEDRLRSRFGVGIMVAISPPDYETRLLITKAKAKKMSLDLSADIVKYMATNLSENIRQIEGALKKIRAFRDLAGMDLTIESVSKTIEDIRTSESSVMVTPTLIIHNVCRYYGVEENILRGPQRSRNISEPRQVSMYLMRLMIGMSQDDIAKVFSRDRTTVLHSLKQVDKTLQMKGNKLEPILQDLQANIAACF